MACHVLKPRIAVELHCIAASLHMNNMLNMAIDDLCKSVDRCIWSNELHMYRIHMTRLVYTFLQVLTCSEESDIMGKEKATVGGSTSG